MSRVLLWGCLVIGWSACGISLGDVLGLLIQLLDVRQDLSLAPDSKALGMLPPKEGDGGVD